MTPSADDPAGDRYVIQHHTGQGDDHFDFMLQRGEALWTWRIARLPASEALPLAAERIADHRLAYLTYEGPVSGGRGEVRIVDAGRLRWRDAGERELAFDLLDGRFAGRWRLTCEGDAWMLKRVDG